MDTTIPIEPGVCVEGRYEVLTALGRGGAGVVWLAADLKFPGRVVALKLLRNEYGDHPEARARFDNEAIALGVLGHPNIVSAVDRGEFRGAPYLVMEHVEGETLRARVLARRNAGETFSHAEVRELFDPIASAIAAAHRMAPPGPIVHRDIKPENIIVREIPGCGPVVKVLDFGIARLGDGRGTRKGSVIGSVRYMAPEQAVGDVERIGPWTDVFALGVLLVELLSTEREPQPGVAWWDAATCPGYDPTSVIERLAPRAPPAVHVAAAWALARDPTSRPRDAAVLYAAIRAAWDEAERSSDTVRIPDRCDVENVAAQRTTRWRGEVVRAQPIAPTVPLTDLARERLEVRRTLASGRTMRVGRVVRVLILVLLFLGGVVLSVAVGR